MNEMRKLMEAVQLNEYLVRDGDSVESLLQLNVFGDTGHREDGVAFSPDDVSWEAGELDPQLQKEWLRKARPYIKQAGLLKGEILKAAQAGKTLSNVEAERAENTWYDGSDLYGELEMAYDELPEVWDNQLEAVLEILEGGVEDDSDYAPFGEGIDEAYDEEMDGPNPFGSDEEVLRQLVRDLQKLERNTSRVYAEATQSKRRPDFAEMALNELGMTLTEITDLVEKYEDFG